MTTTSTTKGASTVRRSDCSIKRSADAGFAASYVAVPSAALAASYVAVPSAALAAMQTGRVWATSRTLKGDHPRPLVSLGRTTG